jgi:homoserine O-acetyltransferase
LLRTAFYTKTPSQTTLISRTVLNAPHSANYVEQPTLVLGIESDGLFTFAEQEEIAQHVPDARLERIDSPEGHDAFLLQFEQVNCYVLAFLNEVLPDIMSKEGVAPVAASVGKIVKSSTFGEAEVEDITAW